MIDDARLREALACRRTEAPTPACLPDEVIERLADGSLGAVEQRAALDHLKTCLACLQAYAGLRVLAEASVPDARTARPGREGAGGSWRRIAGYPVPLGWAIAAAVAIAAVAWGLGTGRLMVRQPAPGREIATTQQERLRMSGVVEEVRDATSSGVPAHTLRFRSSKGERVTVFVWGPPAVAVGDTIQVEGVFVRDAGGQSGIASSVVRRRH